MRRSLNTKNILCSALLVCCLYSVPVFAQDDVQYTDKELQKCVSQLKMDGLSNQYLEQIEQLVYNQVQNRQYDKALKTAQYLINASKKYYGVNHSRTGFAYIARARVYQCMFLFNKSIQDLDIANSIYLKNTTDYDLANNVMLTYAMQYSSVQQPAKSIDYLKKTFSKEYQFNGMSYVYNDIANFYTQAKEMKKAIEYYDKQYKDLVNNDLAISNNMFYHYLAVAGLYQNVGLYSDTEKNLEKAEKLLTQLDDSDKKLLIALNKAKIVYLNEIRYYDESIALLAETEILAEKYGDTYDREHIKSYYIDMYRDKEEFSKTYKYFNAVEKLYSTLPSDSLGDLYPVLEKKIDMYWDMQELEKDYAVLSCALRKLELQKENVPALYAYFLLKKVNIDKESGKFEEAKQTIDTVLEYYKKAVPENSYAFVDVYKRYGELYEFQGKNKEALKYYNKAKDINLALLGNCNRDLADIYSSIANNVEDAKQAIAYIDKAIEIKKTCYGDHHVNVYNTILNKYNILRKYNLEDEADKLFKQIDNDVASNSIKGYISQFNFEFNKTKANKALEENNYQCAEQYANNALKYAVSNRNKKEIYGIKYQIYLNLGHKLKAEKYKKLANIE